MFHVVLMTVALGTLCSAITYSNTNNHLKSVPDNIPTAATIIRLFQNDITEIIDTSFIFENLAELKINNNNISLISPNAFGSVPKISCIDLSYNQLTSMPYVNNLLHLEFLSLQHNIITSFNTNMIQGLYSLKYISLRSNILIEIHIFPYLPSLQTLDISFNKIQIIANDALINVTKLNYFDVSHNRLVIIPDMSYCGNTHTLYLNHNNLGNETAVYLKNLTALKLLDLTDNKIDSETLQEIHNSLLGNNTSHALSKLVLNNNNLTVLPALEGFKSLVYLYAKDNNLQEISDYFFHEKS